MTPPKRQNVIPVILYAIIGISLAVFLSEYKPERIPDDLSGCIIVFYKDTCPDCQATMAEIREALKGTNDVFFLDSQSETGKEIRNQYPIHEVPSAIYVHTADDNYTMYILYEKTDQGTVTNFEAIDRIIELKNNSR